MSRFLNAPLFLLLSTGSMLGLYFPIGKLGREAGAGAVFWALIISLIPGLILSLASLRGFGRWQQGWGFAFVSGLLAYVIPNGITFAAIPHIGSGLMALMFACSPVVTAALSMALGVRPPSGRLLAGVGFGFLGAALIALFRGSLGGAASVWLLFAFLVPLSLGCGNVFRTWQWPAGMTPLRMGGQTNLAASVPLLILLLGFEGLPSVAGLSSFGWLMALQVMISAVMFTTFFRLQWVGGPTYLSQIGYVAAAVGLLAGVAVLDERYPWPVWAGASLIGFGILISNWPRPRPKSEPF